MRDICELIKRLASRGMSRADIAVALALAAGGPMSVYRLMRLFRADRRRMRRSIARLKRIGAVEAAGRAWRLVWVANDTQLGGVDGCQMTPTPVANDTVSNDTHEGGKCHPHGWQMTPTWVANDTHGLSTQILCAGPPLMVPPYNPLPLSPQHPTTRDLTHHDSTDNLSLEGLNDSVELTLNGTRDNFSRGETASSNCAQITPSSRTTTSDQVTTPESAVASTQPPATTKPKNTPRSRKRTPTRAGVADGPRASLIGESRAPSACHENLPAVNPEIHRPVTQPQGAPGSETWEAYASAYEARYGSRPPRNARTNSMCLQLVKRVGAEDAPRLARWYVERAGGIHMRARHPLSLLLRDCEVLLVELRDWRPAVVREWEQMRREVAEGAEWLVEHGIMIPHRGGQSGDQRSH